jgi:antirestriction protein ArdC
VKVQELFEKVTTELVDMIEAGASEWRMPWHRLADAGTPESVDGRAYRGFNALWLPLVAVESDWSSGIWATYPAWQRNGAQVRRGEKATTVVLWKPTAAHDTSADETSPDDDADHPRRRRWLARGYSVFAAEQVDGAEEIVARRADRHGSPAVRIASADAYFKAVGADVIVGGNVACYAPVPDHIRVPPIEQFDDAEHYYSTLGHEHVHWTGHECRLARDLSGRFGSDAYAAEELVAELGAALWCAQTGISPAIRTDHAAYLAHWLNILRADPRHLLTIASRAQTALDWLNTRSGTMPEPTPSEPAAT